MSARMSADSRRVWVVDDDRSVRFVLATALRDAGYEVDGFENAASALAALRVRGAPDLLFTDVRMPGEDGLVLLDRLKSVHPQLPVIVMSAYTDVASTASAFRGGAHEFLSKPFDLDELLSRVRNLLNHHPRRHQRASPPAVELGTFEFGTAKVNFTKYELTIAGKPQQLTKREWELLAFFVQNEGRLIPRQEILESVWQMPGHINTRAPDQFLVRLRKLFEADPANPRHFLTIRDLGYRFVSSPDTSPDDAAESANP